MNTHRFNYLLRQIYYTGDVLSFDELYNYEKSYMEGYIKSNYKQVKDKILYSIEDIINQAWLNAWLFMNKDKIKIDYESDFHIFLAGVAMDTIIEINK
jgi:hypothetical protein